MRNWEYSFLTKCLIRIKFNFFFRLVSYEDLNIYINYIYRNWRLGFWSTRRWLHPMRSRKATPPNLRTLGVRWSILRVIGEVIYMEHLEGITKLSGQEKFRTIAIQWFGIRYCCLQPSDQPNKDPCELLISYKFILRIQNSWQSQPNISPKKTSARWRFWELL